MIPAKRVDFSMFFTLYKLLEHAHAIDSGLIFFIVGPGVLERNEERKNMFGEVSLVSKLTRNLAIKIIGFVPPF